MVCEDAHRGSDRLPGRPGRTTKTADVVTTTPGAILTHSEGDSMSEIGMVKNEGEPSTNRQKPTLSGSIRHTFEPDSMRKRSPITRILRHRSDVRQAQFDEAIAYLDAEIAECNALKRSGIRSVDKAR